jgi:hypothetical protein
MDYGGLWPSDNLCIGGTMSELFETMGILFGIGVFYLLLTWVVIMFMIGRK